MGFLGFARGKPQPREIARDRLKLVLIHDRANCAPHVLEMLKSDILDVISNYMEVDEGDIFIQISQEDDEKTGNMPRLNANIPIKSVHKAPRNP